MNENAEILEEQGCGGRRLTMGKDERLRHRTLVEGLFTKGETLYEYPLRLTYRTLDEKELEESFRGAVPDRIGTLQMLITVPKKKRRHAVDRVLMRRRIREAYRLNRLDLKETAMASAKVRTIGMAFIYLSPENLDYHLIEKKMRKLLGKLAKKLGEYENGDGFQQE